MLAFAVRGVVLLGVLSWYSATVWKMIDGYFKDQFRTYLQEEYRKYPRMRSDVEKAGAVDKEPALEALPTESSTYVEIYAPDAVCPADTADTCPRATASEAAAAAAAVSAVAKEVTGGSSENAAAGSTDKNAFPESASRSPLESRKLPDGSSDTHDGERRSNAINQGDGHEEEATGSPPTSPPRPVKPRRRYDKRKASTELSREKPAKRRVNTIVLTDADFERARRSDDGYDFSEFEDVDEEGRKVLTEGILVSDLPFKPKADIGNLERVTAEEFCPLTLEDEASCGETTTWP
ncbi:uncharacterized protein LOC105187992 [Harpegnathos saltator]|uniref:uncharacterized protein LOC105187992 n=1 Tax=Harpegnathos saltator TaxID=610380 RepID=UPI0005901E81|nr:uncharacterized protein LOC105187992 [Harpegnathos saltator]